LPSPLKSEREEVTTGAPPWLTVKVWPAMVMVPERAVVDTFVEML
jgi:hypothetical protein